MPLPPGDVQLTIRVFASQGTETRVPIYEVTLTAADGAGVWIEDFGSLPDLQAFLTGVRAGLGVAGKMLFVPYAFREDWIKARLHEAPFQLWPE